MKSISLLLLIGTALIVRAGTTYLAQNGIALGWSPWPYDQEIAITIYATPTPTPCTPRPVAPPGGTTAFWGLGITHE